MFTNILQPTHLLIVLVVALLLLGPRRLPEAGRAIGQGLREFRNSISGEHHEDQDAPPAAAALTAKISRLGQSQDSGINKPQK